MQDYTGETAAFGRRIAANATRLGANVRVIHPFAPRGLRTSEVSAFVGIEFWTAAGLTAFHRLVDEVRETWCAPRLGTDWAYAAAPELTDLREDLRLALSWRRDRRRDGRDLLAQHIAQLRRDHLYGVGVPARDLPLVDTGLAQLATERASGTGWRELHAVRWESGKAGNLLAPIALPDAPRVDTSPCASLTVVDDKDPWAALGPDAAPCTRGPRPWATPTGQADSTWYATGAGS